MAASQQCLNVLTGSKIMQREEVSAMFVQQIASSYDDDDYVVSSQSHHKSVTLLFLLLTLSCLSGPEHFVSQSFLLDGRDVGHAGDVAMDTC